MCYSILIRIKGFLEFCLINSINNDSIYQIIPYLKIRFYPKDSHIFKLGDYSKYFYCVLSGKVSIRFPVLNTRKRSSNNKSENKTIDSNNSNNTLNTSNSTFQEKSEYKPSYVSKNFLKNQGIKRLCNYNLS